MYLSLLDENIDDVKKNFMDKPFFVFLSLTNSCNANCVFCDVRNNKETCCSINVYKLIDELAELGTKYIHFTGGGEPFTDKNIVAYMEYASKKGLNIVFITNGFLLKDQVEKLSKINLKAVFVSLDSCFPKIHNSLRRTQNLFENAVIGINELKKKHPLVKINFNHVINKQNIDDFENFIRLKDSVSFDYINPILIKDCKELTPTQEQISKFNNNKTEYISLLRKYNINLLTDSLDIFSDKIDENGGRLQNQDMRCAFARFSAFIDCPSGRVFPCDCSIHRDRKLYLLGSLHKSTFKEIWESPQRKNLVNQLDKGTFDCKAKCDEANCIFNDAFYREV